MDWDKVLKYVKENAEYEFNPMTHPYLNWTQEQIVERIRKVKDIREISNFMGFYSLRDKAVAAGEYHPFSGVGFFILPRENGSYSGSLSTLISGGSCRSHGCQRPDAL